MKTHEVPVGPELKGRVVNALGAPIDGREDTEDGVLVQARLPHGEIRRFAEFLVADAAHEKAV